MNEEFPKENEAESVKAREELEKRLIGESSSFEELYEALTELGSLRGSRQLFQAARLIEIVDSVRNEEGEFDEITNAGGLRDKVRELMKAEAE